MKEITPEQRTENIFAGPIAAMKRQTETLARIAAAPAIDAMAAAVAELIAQHAKTKAADKPAPDATPAPSDEPAPATADEPAAKPETELEALVRLIDGKV